MATAKKVATKKTPAKIPELKLPVKKVRILSEAEADVIRCVYNPNFEQAVKFIKDVPEKEDGKSIVKVPDEFCPGSQLFYYDTREAFDRRYEDWKYDYDSLERIEAENAQSEFRRSPP